jgi:hypothetical protein
MRYSDQYVTTIFPETLEMTKAALRPWIRKANKALSEENASHSLRLVFRGRLGRNNPHRHLYQRRFQYHVKAEHAARIDVYLHRVTNYNRWHHVKMPQKTFDMLKEVCVLLTDYVELFGAIEHEVE